MFSRFKLNIWDVGGQKSLRSYWRNYFESTDGLVWVVDSADRLRMEDCRQELSVLLQEEVKPVFHRFRHFWRKIFVYVCRLTSNPTQRLAGATLLVFANKQDLPGALSKDAIQEVTRAQHFPCSSRSCNLIVAVLLQALALDEIKSHHWCIIGCSAVTGENLLAGVDWLLDDIAARIFTAE